jgi:hypothetical protein
MARTSYILMDDDDVRFVLDQAQLTESYYEPTKTL